MPAYIIAMLHQHVDYVKTTGIYNSSVCVFVPFVLATSRSDEGETFAVFLEDYTLDQCIFPFNSSLVCTSVWSVWPGFMLCCFWCVCVVSHFFRKRGRAPACCGGLGCVALMGWVALF